MEKIEKFDNPCHTVLVLKNGSLDVWSLEELKKDNYFYKTNSKIPGFELIDYDKTNIVPIVKDILNRQHTFIEIKYLITIMILSFISLVLILLSGILVYRVDINTPKNEIINSISQFKKEFIEQQQALQTKLTTPEKIQPIIHKNIPNNTTNYAN